MSPVTLQAQKEYPLDMQCKDKFLLQSTVVNSDVDELPPDTFNKDSGRNVEGCKLRVVYISPHSSPGHSEDAFKQSSDVNSAWTNGRLKRVIHRAVVNKERQRLSMAYFMNPTSSATIECPPQLIDSVSNPRKYVPFTWAELRHLLLTTKRVRGKAVAINKFLISS